ncbi:MAG: arsenical pump-driving ATPase [Verrucomicrobiota bacterium]
MEFLLQDAPRFLFFTGKGGVGKTSLACATSLALADAGKRVLLISTDPASNLDEVLETALGGTPHPVRGAPRLHALNIDPEEAAEAYRERIVGPSRGLLPEAAVARIEEQLSGACTTEIASFNEFSLLIGDEERVKQYDHVVLDTAPTGHTLRLLNLPAAWHDFIAQNQTGSSCLGPLSGLQAQRDVYERAAHTLTDGRRTALVLVARADQASLKEAARAGDELRTLGIAHQHLIVNAVFEPQNADDPLARAWREESRAALDAMPPTLQALPRAEVPFYPVGAIGIERLRALVKPPLRHEDRQTRPSPATQPTLPLIPGFADLVEDLSSVGRGVVLAMGKGGVGKTTVAVSLARALAGRGHTVLLSTTDPADHVSDALGDVPPNLEIHAIDPKEETRRHVEQVLATTGAGLDTDARALLEEELRSPCIEEIAVFTAFAKAVAQGEDRIVVMDTAPTGHTLLLLDTTEAYHREVARTGSELPEAVRQLLPRLRDPDYTRVLLVTLPEATPVHEAAFLQKDLIRAGLQPHAWVINQSLAAAESTDELLRAKARFEAPFIQDVVEKHARGPAYLIPWSVAARHGFLAPAFGWGPPSSCHLHLPLP